MKTIHFDSLFWKTMVINVVGVLALVTFAHKVSGNNDYIFSILIAMWMLAIMVYDIKHFSRMLEENWHGFKQQKWKYLLLIVILFIVMHLTLALASPYFNQFIPDVPFFETPNSSMSLAKALLGVFAGIVSLGIAFIEEIAFRYVGVYRFKNDQFTLALMIIISNLLFGFTHYYNFGGSFLATIPYAMAGVILSVAYLCTKNIWVPIFAHLMFNSVDILGALVVLIMYPLTK